MLLNFNNKNFNLNNKNVILNLKYSKNKKFVNIYINSYLLYSINILGFIYYFYINYSSILAYNCFIYFSIIMPFYDAFGLLDI